MQGAQRREAGGNRATFGNNGTSALAPALYRDRKSCDVDAGLLYTVARAGPLFVVMCALLTVSSSSAGGAAPEKES